ncbi:MAG: alkaline phosphatase family protein [Anaerolineae bacterium]|nr:alkaline phosphatase family protein [Anaerolineae bacterium]
MTENRRVLVIGLDGATLDLARPWAEAGLLPTFRRLLQEGAWGELTTVIPPITGPAWSSFLTGMNPGKHGLYDFMRLAPGTYDIQPVNATLRAGESLWSRLSRAGKQVIVLNVPAIYPPEPVNGVLVTGMMTPPQAPVFTYPTELGQELRDAPGGYDIWPAEVFHPQGRERRMIAALSRLTAQTERALDILQRRVPDWDFCMAVFMATDTVQHFAWHFMDATHSRHPAHAPADLRDAILRAYQEMDAVLARLLNQVDERTLLIVMSDHGFGPLEKYLYVNAWLLETRFLRLRNHPVTRLKYLLNRAGFTPILAYNLLMRLGLGAQIGRTVRARKGQVRRGLGALFLSFDDVDWPRTRAYSLGNVGPIYVNLRGREPQGIVEPGAKYERAISDLVAALDAWRDPTTGQKIVGHVYRREELFHGERAAYAPDLFVMPADLRYQAFGEYQFPSRAWLGRAHDRSGAHRLNGLAMLAGAGARRGLRLDGASIMDLAPTILAALGLPIPLEMDGRVLSEAFAEGFLAPVMASEAESPAAREEATLTADEDAAVRAHLKGLGYLG